MVNQDRIKRITLFLLVAGLFILLGYAILRIYQGSNGTVVPSGTSPVSGGIQVLYPTPTGLSATPLTSPDTGLKQEIQEKRLIQLTDFPVIGPMINTKQDKVLFYQKEGGDMFEVDITGVSRNKLSNITIVGILDALWSPLRDRAAVFYIDNENIKSFLHIGTSTIASLPINIKSLSWSPDGKDFVFLAEDHDTLAMLISDKTGKNQKTVYHTSILDAQLTWISSDKIAFLTAPSGFARGYLFIYYRSGGTLKRIIGPFWGLQSLWSPDGSRVLVSYTDYQGKNLQMEVYDNNGKSIKKLTAKTLPEKCAWVNSVQFYCGVPKQIPFNVPLPDNYLTGEFATQDTLSLIDSDTGDATEIINEGSFDMTNLRVTKNKDFIIWVNKTDGTLWSYRLEEKAL